MVIQGLHVVAGLSCHNPSQKEIRCDLPLRWFARPDRVNTEPYYELPLPVTKLRSIFHFRVGAHSLPIEQGRVGIPRVPRHYAGAHFVPPLLSATSAILCLIALGFRAFGSSMQKFSRILMMP